MPTGSPLQLKRKIYSQTEPEFLTIVSRFRMECRRLGNDLTPRNIRSWDCDDGDGSLAELMEFMDDEPSTNPNAGRNIVLGHGDSAAESSPGSFSTSSASSPSKCEQERGNSPNVSLPLQEGIRRRLTFKQRQPPAYQKKPRQTEDANLSLRKRASVSHVR